MFKGMSPGQVPEVNSHNNTCKCEPDKGYVPRHSVLKGQKEISRESSAFG